MEVDFGRVKAVDTNFGLAVVEGEANVVDGNRVRGYDAGQLEEGIEVPLCWKWNCDDTG